MTNDNRLCDEIAERVAAIANDRRHGAAELARQCLDLLGDAAEHIPAADSEELHDQLQRLAGTLIASRPSMTSVTHLVSLWLQRCGTSRTRSLEELRRIAQRAARGLVEESRAATQAAAAHAAELLANCRTLVTHSYSSTVYETISRLHAHVQVIFSESRPLYEGHRLAQALSQRGREATLVTDAQLGSAVQYADAVLVGADSVLTDGSLVNKAGTLLVAAAAAHFEVPLYGCCESHKLRTADMPDIQLERMDPEELGAPEWPGIAVQNVYFDVTPPALLSGCIMETGLRLFPGYRNTEAANL
jgi:translation initiation factor eIF-2B subunit delta